MSIVRDDIPRTANETPSIMNDRDPSIPLARNEHLVRWVEKMVQLAQPAEIHWVDGSKEEVEKNAKTIERIIAENGGFDVLRAKTKEEEDKLWDVRRAISPSLMKYGTLKINEDVVVPRSKVPELVARIEDIGRKHDTFVANFGHAGDGNIHVNFVVDREDADAIARARQCVSETFQLSVDLGGTISGEHGIGYVKAQYLNYAIDRPTLEIMKGIKKVFDPNGILNPGKMFV